MYSVSAQGLETPIVEQSGPHDPQSFADSDVLFSGFNSTSDEECPPQYGRVLVVVESGDEVVDSEPRKESKVTLDYVRTDNHVAPLSQYAGYVPPHSKRKERHIISKFMTAISRRKESLARGAVFDDEEFVEFELSDFTIYLPGTNQHHAWEMRGLQNLATQTGSSCCLFDGTLSYQDETYSVEGVPFEICSIGNYGQAHDTVNGNIWIQSKYNKSSDVYYRLKEPSSPYARYHEDFLWLADLGKHFVDYLQAAEDDDRLLSIHDFRSRFSIWLATIHQGSEALKSWQEKHKGNDFRSAVSANIDFLFKEAIGINDSFRSHVIWNEVQDMNHIPSQPMQEKATIVTPYVFECFKHLKSGIWLKAVVPSIEAERRKKSMGSSLSLTVQETKSEEVQVAPPKARNNMKRRSPSQGIDPMTVSIGDVIAIQQEDQKASKWKQEASRWKIVDECWYVYVQSIHLKGGKREFGGIWLYRPSETTCALMKYPYENELFLSDHCLCEESRISEDEVLYKVDIDWFGAPHAPGPHFFVRQTYIVADHSFVTLKASHRQCSHQLNGSETDFQMLSEKYQTGVTVLVSTPSNLNSKYDLDPAEILELYQEGRLNLVKVRRLLRYADVIEKLTISDARRSQFPPRPNELVYTDEEFVVDAEDIARSCYVRFYSLHDIMHKHIPTPYDRDGTGDAFIISSRLVTDERGVQELQYIEAEKTPSSLKQGFDPIVEQADSKMRGLDLFSGGGTFGRGLEEGGAIRYETAVDICPNALHSLYANLESPNKTRLFLGSVDDFLLQALRGNPKRSPLIPQVGEVDFISAGSPCTGFSLLNSLKDNVKGLKNQSLVASVAAHIDFYRPMYGLLENVVTMASKGKYREEDMLSQLVCCLVGMGYQTQMFVLDAWSFGSPQSRSRLFVSIAAPGLTLPTHPGLTHAHPPDTRDRGLGKMSNGLSFGRRRFDPTPFPYITAGEATEDLPDIGDGLTGVCISHPDHRMSIKVKRNMKRCIEAIPIYPRGMNFVKTMEAKLLSQTERDFFPYEAKSGHARQSTLQGSRAYERVNPQRLFPTIATCITPQCSRGGKALHWNQQRLLTVMEVRRAQSYPDHEVLTGSTAKQWRIVGNSVARTVALALGLSLREAWLNNSADSSKRALLALKNDQANRRAVGDVRPVNIVYPPQISPPCSVSKTSRYALKFHEMVHMSKTTIRTETLAHGETASSSDESQASDRQFRKSLEALGITSSGPQSLSENSSSTNSSSSSSKPANSGQKRERDMFECVELDSSAWKKAKHAQNDNLNTTHVPHMIPNTSTEVSIEKQSNTTRHLINKTNHQTQELRRRSTGRIQRRFEALSPVTKIGVARDESVAESISSKAKERVSSVETNCLTTRIKRVSTHKSKKTIELLSDAELDREKEKQK